MSHDKSKLLRLRSASSLSINTWFVLHFPSYQLYCLSLAFNFKERRNSCPQVLLCRSYSFYFHSYGISILYFHSYCIKTQIVFCNSVEATQVNFRCIPLFQETCAIINIKTAPFLVPIHVRIASNILSKICQL